MTSEITHAIINKILSIQNLNCIAPGLNSGMLFSYSIKESPFAISEGFFFFLLSIISDAGL